MFTIIERTVIMMALFRIFSGSLEVFAALLMMKLNNIEKALIINTTLAFIGPFILIVTTTIGLYGIADKVSLSKFLWIIIGFICILYGIKSG